VGKILAEYGVKFDQDFQDLARNLDQDARDAAIQEAVMEYSKHRPRIMVMDVAGDGATYDIPLGTAPGPTDWIEDFSVVRQVEYPAGEREPVYLEQDEWREYVKPTTGRVLRLIETTPATGESTRVTYSIPQTVSADTGTIPDSDFYAVVQLAASYAAHGLAMFYAQQGDSTIGADSVDHKSKSSDYATRAKDLRALYFAHMGMKDERGAPAASVHMDWDRIPGHGDDYLTHPREWR
jgi:hypothetical protein